MAEITLIPLIKTILISSHKMLSHSRAHHHVQCPLPRCHPVDSRHTCAELNPVIRRRWCSLQTWAIDPCRGRRAGRHVRAPGTGGGHPGGQLTGADVTPRGQRGLRGDLSWSDLSGQIRSCRAQGGWVAVSEVAHGSGLMEWGWGEDGTGREGWTSKALAAWTRNFPGSIDLTAH